MSELHKFLFDGLPVRGAVVRLTDAWVEILRRRASNTHTGAYPAPVQNMLMAGDLDMGHARALLPLDGATQITTATEIAAKKLSVREAEKLVAKQQGAARQQPLLRVKNDKSRDVLRLEEELADALGATVEVRVKKRSKRGQSGELAIHFDSLDALSGILDKLRAS